MSELEKAVYAMRSGGFGTFPKSKTLSPEAFLGSPPPETEPDLVGAWVSGEPWNVTGYSVRFPTHRGLSEQEMMDLEISYADSAETVRGKMEFPALPPDPEAADAFKAMSELLRPGQGGTDAPSQNDLVSGFAASLGEVIRTYAPRHAGAIGAESGEFVAGPKLGPALQAFAVLLSRTVDLNGDSPELPASDGVGAFFISPNRAIDLRTLFDRAAFRSLMMGETVPRALGVAMFEARHALDERLSAQRLPAQESWEALLASAADYFLSTDRELVGRIGFEIVEAKKPERPSAPAADVRVQTARPAAQDPWGGGGPIDEDDPASFGL